LHTTFQEDLQKEVTKVHTFYVTKVEEQDKLPRVLVASVDGPAGNSKETHKVRRSMADIVVTQLKHMVGQHHYQHSGSSISAHPSASDTTTSGNEKEGDETNVARC
jgi:hypothetical protein